MEAMTKATDLLEPMVSRILSLGVKARYVLMDSWFAMPVTIAKLRKHNEEVVRLYGKRWDIEVFFKMSKQLPGSGKEHSNQGFLI